MNEIEQIKKETKVVDLINTISDIEKRINIISIDNEVTQGQGVEIAGDIKIMVKNIEDYRKGYVNPHNLIVKSINNMFRPFNDKLKKLNDVIKNKLTKYQRELDMKAEAEAKAKEVAPAADMFNGEPEAPPPDTVIRTGTGNMHFQNKWVFKIIDLDKVPRKYFIIDESKIRNEIIHCGVREISGIEIKQEKNPVIR